MLGEARNSRDGLGIAGAFAGVLLIAQPPMLFGGGTPPPLLGVVFALTSACFSASAYLLIRLLTKQYRVHWATLLLWHAIFQPILSPIAMAISPAPWPPLPSLWETVCAIGTSTCGTMAQLLMTVGMGRARNAASAAAMRCGDLPAAFVWQLTFFRGTEPVSAMSACGAVVVVAALGVIISGKSSAPQQAPPDKGSIALAKYAPVGLGDDDDGDDIGGV